MPLTDNNGTQYYAIPCGVPSTTTNLSSNNSTGYYRNSANEFILWGQSTLYPSVTSNNGSKNYFLKCGVASDVGLDLLSNNGTKYYYRSEFNCVSFCNETGTSSETLWFNGGTLYYNGGEITYNN